MKKADMINSIMEMEIHEWELYQFSIDKFGSEHDVTIMQRTRYCGICDLCDKLGIKHHMEY